MKRKCVIIACLIICIIMTSVFVSCNKFQKSKETYKLSMTELELLDGDAEVLEVSKGKITYNNVKWSSTDEKIAIVNGGTVRTLAPGKVTIIAEIDGEILTCKVTVLSRDIKLSDESILLSLNERRTLSITQRNEVVTSNVIWRSENEHVARIDNDGKVIGSHVGTTFVYAFYNDKMYMCLVNVIVGFHLPGKYEAKIKVPNLNNEEIVFAIAIREDGAFVYTRKASKTLKLETITDGKCKRDDEKIIFDGKPYPMEFYIEDENTIKSIGKIKTGIADMELTFRRVK